MRIFNNIINLPLKLKGELPINRDELLALVNSWGRNCSFFTLDKDYNEIEIKECKPKEKYDLSNLDVSEISNFDSIFKYSNFNRDINSWDVSNATSMISMFSNAENFNKLLDNWNVSNVTDMSYMFKGARYFNQSLNSWNVSNVKSMFAMFYKNKNFNSPLDKWDVSNVTDISSMFSYAKNFNQNINMWNVSKVEKMCFMFSDTKEFNQPLDKWNTSKVTDMYYMFYGAEKFNQNLNSWDVSKVKYMNSIFADSKKFNQVILWDLSKVENCAFIFYNSIAFKNRFNNKIELSRDTNEIKEWLIENYALMEAIYIKDNKSNELNKFILNISLENKSFIERLFINSKFLLKGNR